jgi:hypothetical protein
MSVNDILPTISPFGIDGNTSTHMSSPLHSVFRLDSPHHPLSALFSSPFDINVKEETFFP